MTNTVDAVLIGPDSYFGADAVLYVPGQIVPDVPANLVSDQPFHEEIVKVAGVDGKLRDRAIQRPTRFRPIGEARPL